MSLPLLYYCSWTVAILLPWVFYRSIFQSYGSCKTLLCEFRQAKKKISHVSSSRAALLGFLFAIKLFLILTTFLLFARKIIILSRHRDISLLSHVVSDGLNKYPLHKAHQAGQKGISPLLADLKFRKCLFFEGEKTKSLEGLRHAITAAVLILHSQLIFIHLRVAFWKFLGEVKS